MKNRIIVAVSIVLILTLSLGTFCVFAENDAKSIRESVLRFHIIANSNSKNDQNAKIMLRDYLKEKLKESFLNATDKADAIKLANSKLDYIKTISENYLKSIGCNQNVSVKVGKRYFPTKTYGNCSFPCGTYDALIITLGSGKGKNFWCVMFPPLCVTPSSVTDDKTNEKLLSGVLNESALNLVSDKKMSITFKFKIVEIIESIKEIIKK